MKKSVKLIVELFILVAVLGALGGAGWLALRYAGRRATSCEKVRDGEDARRCRALEAALEDFRHPDRIDLQRWRCRDYLARVGEFLQLDVEGVRDKTRRYAEQCIALQGGRL